MPFGVSPFTAAPTGKLGAVDGAAFDILKHADSTAGSASVNAQSFDYAVIRVNTEGGVAHAKSPILSRQFLQARSDIHKMAGGAVTSSQNLVLALIGTDILSRRESHDRQQQENEVPGSKPDWMV